MYAGRSVNVLCETLLLTFGELSDIVLMLLHATSIFQLRSKYITVMEMEYCISEGNS